MNLSRTPLVARVVFAAVLAGALLATGGCGPSMAGGSRPSTPSVAATPAGATVVISGFAFNPGSVTITAGQTVTWRNDDGVPHDATGSDWTSGSISSGESYTRHFDTPGTYTYICKVHPAMKSATVVVQ